MSAKNRADLIAKLHRVVKKEFEVITPPSNRTVMDHSIYACCLENSTFEAADEALAKLQENYFDWNEVRVTTDRELAEAMKNLTHPMRAAERVKKMLYGIFETYYQFDLEFLKKENLGKAVAAFENMTGVTSFGISYLSQHGLGGHSIPTDRALLELMVLAGILTEDEAVKGRVPGLERAIPKAKGIEFASLVHQLSVGIYKSPFSTKLRDIVLKVDAGAKDRFPKRGSRKPIFAVKSAPAVSKVEAAEDVEDATEPAAKPDARTAGKKTSAAKAKAAKAAPAKSTPAKAKATARTVAKKSPAKTNKAPTKTVAKPAAKKKTSAKSPTRASAKSKTAAKKKAVPAASAVARKKPARKTTKAAASPVKKTKTTKATRKKASGKKPR